MVRLVQEVRQLLLLGSRSCDENDIQAVLAKGQVSMNLLFHFDSNVFLPGPPFAFPSLTDPRRGLP